MIQSAKDLYEGLKHIKIGGSTCVYSKEKCDELFPYITEINELKKKNNAIILAHSYVTPEIIHSVADFVGDSYELSKKAKETNATTIIFAAVKFMAETAKILNPEKHVYFPSMTNGCSLADSITGDDVRTLRKKYPDYTFVCYINTTADVKSECDVCVTSSNVYKIIETIENENIVFLPDNLMGKNLIDHCKKNKIKKNIILWNGTCYVHEEYDPDMIKFIKNEYKNVEVVSHPECHPNILALSDYVGSTAQMMNYVKETKAPSYFMLTECGLTTRLKLENPSKNFVGSCTICKYMKANNLKNILEVLKNKTETHEIKLDKTISKKAKYAIDNMFKYVDLASKKRQTQC